MQASSRFYDTILGRIAQLDLELKRTRADLRNLRTHDPSTEEVVMRGARLAGERASLERRLEILRQGSI